MSESASPWIDLDERQPAARQFVRVQVRERVEQHWIEFEGQAFYDPDNGWLHTNGRPYLSGDQQIVAWKPLLDSSFPSDLDDLIVDLGKD